MDIDLDAKPVIVTCLTCPNCGYTVFSRARHDMRSCSCKQSHIDGGFDYVKFGFKGDEPKRIQIAVDASRRELYDDWNQRTDLYGVIDPGVVLVPIERPPDEDDED